MKLKMITKGKKKINTNLFKLIFLFGINFFAFGCSNKLLNPIKNGTFGNEQKSIFKSSVYLFVYPNKSLDVCSVEKCKVKIVKKIDNEYFILTEGKYEISYANLNECFVTEGEILRKGKIIGNIGNNYSKYNLDTPYLRITVKDKKGIFIENSNIFK